MEAAARHVDRLDLLGRGLPDRLEVAVANREIVADRPPESAHPQDVRLQMRAVLALDLHDQPPFLDG